MIVVVNVILVAAAFMLVLVIAATSSLPTRDAPGNDFPEGEWMGPVSLPTERKMQAMATGTSPERQAWPIS